MSFELSIITDLAVLLVIGSAVAFVFHKFKQPLILGYLVAGVIIGPYSPPFSLISHVEFINVFAEIGVILLLFIIGLEFPINKLKSLGKVVIGVSTIEIAMMLAISWVVGAFLNWGLYDTLFLGAALASSSTTIIAKVLDDTGKTKEISATIMMGILVVEDIVVVIVLAMLQNLAVTSTVSAADSLWLIGKLAIFFAGTLVVGGYFIPKAVDKVARTESKELLYVALLGICFLFAILSSGIGFSAAIGAFLIGVVVARAKCREEINRQIQPFQLVFGAIFFVSMGALMDVMRITEFWFPAMIVTIAVVLTKLLSCSLGTRLFGYSKETALQVGLGMGQIGEFAFIVVKAGQDLGVVSSFLLPIVGVAVMVTAFSTPYMINFSFKD
jgi:monovalent cation:H+ antiporter-2, CPA2 family